MSQIAKQTKILEKRLEYLSGEEQNCKRGKRKFVAFEPQLLAEKAVKNDAPKDDGSVCGASEERNKIMETYQKQLWRRVSEIVNQKDHSRIRNLQIQLQEKIQIIKQITNQNKESRIREIENQRKQNVEKKQHQKLLGLLEQIQAKYNECEKRLKQTEKIREQQQEQLIENRNRFIDMEAKLQNLQGINESLSEQLKLKSEQINRIQSTNIQLQQKHSVQQQINQKALQQITAFSEQIVKLNSNLTSTQQRLNSAKDQLNLKAASHQQDKRLLQAIKSQNRTLTIQLQQLKRVNQQLRVKLQNMDISKNLAQQLKGKIEEMKQLRKINEDLEQLNFHQNQTNQISNIQIVKLKEINSFYEEKNRGLQNQILRINQVNQSIQKSLDSIEVENKQNLLENQLQRAKNQQMTIKVRNLEEINKSIAQQLRTKIEQIIEIRKITQDLQNKKLQKQCQILNLKGLLNPPPITLSNIQSPFISIEATEPTLQQKNHSISMQYSQTVSSPLQQLNIARFVSESSVPSSEPFLQQRQKFSDKSSQNSQQRSVFRLKSDYHRTQSIDSGLQIQQQFDFRNLQAKCLLLQKQLQLKTNEYVSVSQLLHQKQNELYSMRQQFQSYPNLIDQLRKRIQQLQKQPIIYHRPSSSDINLQQKMNHWHQLINSINRNCLKNNCDSTGIINIELNGIQEKNVIDFINLSPTDIEKFNKKQDIDFNVEHNYGGNSSAQTEGYHFYRSEEQLDMKKEGELKQPGNFSRKISIQSENYAEKEAAAFKLARQKEEENRICHTQSQQVHNPIPAPTSPSKQNQASQCGENGKSLSICNNANSEFKLTYQQLHQKCLRTQRENEKMWEYLRLLHGLNHKWKKSTAEIDHQSKVNVLVKLSEKLNNLLQRDRHSESQQLIANQLGNLIKDVQSYIHFLDHLIKIQPFQDGHRAPYHSKKSQATSQNNANHLYSKKTYSEGCCRQDDYVENFDIYPYEIDQIPRGEQELRKEVEKKQLFEMEKFNNEEKKDWFSEISSVKNQSQSQMSKSELIQLQMYMRGNFIREEADSFKEARRDHNDSSKAEPKSFNELRHMYQKLREEYQQLLRQKNNHEKIYRKQIERVESEYIKKMSKMTKDFNDTFGLLCQRSGLHKREKPVQKHFYSRETQVDVENAPMMRKKSHSRTSFEEAGTKVQEIVEIATQQLQLQLKDCQQRVKDSLVAQQKLKESNNDLQRKLAERQDTVDKFARLYAAQKKSQQALQVKLASDFQEFVQKLTIKNKIKDLSLGIEEKGKSFRKSSVSIVPCGEYISATKVAEVKISSEFILRTIFQMISAESQELKENINEQQFKTILTDKLEKYKKTIVNKVIIELVHKLQSLMHFEEQQLISMKNWSQAFQEFTDYEEFSIKSLSELCELMFKKSYSSHYLPINSKSNSDQSYNGEKHLMLYSRNSETELKKQLQEQKLCNQLIKKEKMELSDKINRLQSEMINAKKQLKLRQQSYSTLIANNPFQGMMHEKEKQIIQLQQEIMALREQSTRLKLKSKKGKIIRIDH